MEFEAVPHKPYLFGEDVAIIPSVLYPLSVIAFPL